jgi:hypothetical protein
MAEKFTVIRSRRRSYGYSIQAPSDVTWAIGPGGSFGWYRKKSDAQRTADAHNKAREKTCKV